MGRYTSVQGFGDYNSRITKISYDQAKRGENEIGEDSNITGEIGEEEVEEEGRGIKLSLHGDEIDTKRQDHQSSSETNEKFLEKESNKLVVEKIKGGKGSGAAASSTSFFNYMYSINREKLRIEQMEKVEIDKKLEFEFQQDKDRKRREAEEKTRKNAAKRKKRKLKEIQKKKGEEEKSTIGESNANDEVRKEGGEVGNEEGDELKLSNNGQDNISYAPTQSTAKSKTDVTKIKEDEEASLRSQDPKIGKRESKDQNTRKTSGNLDESDDSESSDDSDDGRGKKKFILQYKRL